MPRIVLASALMGLALLVIARVLDGWFWDAGLPRRIAALGALVLGGLAVYGIVIVMAKVARPADITGLFKRERNSALTKGGAEADNPNPPETLSSNL